MFQDKQHHKNHMTTTVFMADMFAASHTQLMPEAPRGVRNYSYCCYSLVLGVGGSAAGIVQVVK